MNHENLRPIFELGFFQKEEAIPLIESRGYECLGWLVVDRASFEENKERELRILGCNLYCRESPDGKYLYKSFNTCYSRRGRAYDQKSVLVFRKEAGQNETD